MDKKTILIVDDEASVRLLVKRILGRRYVVLGAINGGEALAMVREEKPDLILMDILMPGMDGYTTCAAIKTDQATKAIPVLMLTALDYELNKELASQMGADGYITKPFTSRDLRDAISQCLGIPIKA